MNNFFPTFFSYFYFQDQASCDYYGNDGLCNHVIIITVRWVPYEPSAKEWTGWSQERKFSWLKFINLFFICTTQWLLSVCLFYIIILTKHRFLTSSWLSLAYLKINCFLAYLFHEINCLINFNLSLQSMKIPLELRSNNFYHHISHDSKQNFP